MENKPKKIYNRKPTHKQALAAKISVEKVGISKGQAMREAGYAASTADNPSKLTNSKAYRQVLEEAGLTDEYLARGHREAAEAVEIKERQFLDTFHMELVEIPKDSPEYKKNGREKQYQEVPTHTPVSHKTIKDFFNKITGVTLLRIEQGYRFRTAVYLAPLHVVRKDSRDSAYKVKGHFAAEKVEHEFTPPTTAELDLIRSVLKQNATDK